MSRMNFCGGVVTLIRVFLLCQRIKRLDPLRHARGGACDHPSTHKRALAAVLIDAQPNNRRLTLAGR